MNVKLRRAVSLLLLIGAAWALQACAVAAGAAAGGAAGYVAGRAASDHDDHDK
jgi:hypothetical protein